MITFYTNSVAEALENMETVEWKTDAQNYIESLNGCFDGKELNKETVLLLFELDAYDIYITWEDVIHQTSRLAKTFREWIQKQFDEINHNNVSKEDMNYEIDYLIGKSFAENLKYLRHSLNLTQKELARLSGVTVKSIINYENEPKRIPTGKNLCLLARFFEVNPIELLGTDID